MNLYTITACTTSGQVKTGKMQRVTLDKMLVIMRQLKGFKSLTIATA